MLCLSVVLQYISTYFLVKVINREQPEFKSIMTDIKVGQPTSELTQFLYKR